MFKKIQDQFSKSLLDAVSGVLENSPEEIDMNEASAAADARRALHRDSKGLAATKRDEDDNESNEDPDEDKTPHLVSQLYKAVSVKKPVKFKNGESHTIAPHHAKKFIHLYRSLKPADKEELQSKAHASHAEFKKAISEATAVNKHGHDHVDQEDGDVNNDGKMNNTDSFLKARRKAIAKTMSMKKEDVEQLEEGEGIVTPKQHNYGEPPKGTYAYERKYGKYTAKGDLRKRPNPNKPPMGEEVEQVVEKLSDEAKTAIRHAAGGIGAKVKPLVKLAQMGKKSMGEEVEQIDELSKDTMKSYKDNAAWDKDYETGAVDPKARERREKGIAMANKKLAKEEAETVTEAPVDGVAAGSMEGDKHLCATKVLHKEWAEGTPIFSQHAEPDFLGNIAWYDVMFEHGIERQVPTSDMEILMSESHMHSKKKMKEEVEELDEISAEMKGRYKKAASRDIDRAQDFKSELDHEGEPEGSRVRKDVDRIIKNRETGMKRANEDVELDEARGRPKKGASKDFTIHPKTKEKLMHNNPADMKKIELLQKNKVIDKPKVEAGQHVINQLQKAKLSMRGGETINFTHGESKHVSGVHAAKLLTKYAGMKPSDKEAFQKKIGHSHENLKSEL